MKLLLVGTPRAGTTWSAGVLSRARGATLVHEPDGPPTDLLGAMVASRLGPYPCLEPADQPAWYPVVWDLAYKGGWPWQHWEPAHVAGRRIVRIPTGLRDRMIVALARGTTWIRVQPEHTLIKSVNCELALDWVVRRYEFDHVIVMRRNLLNVVSSWLALGWPLIDPPLESDPRVRRRYIEPLGLPEPPAASDHVGRTAWQVGLLTTALKLATDAHPEWHLESHDLYCTDPRRYFAALFERLGLEWTDAVGEFLASSDRAGYSGVHPIRRTRDQPEQWRRRLTSSQVDQISGVLAGFPLGQWSDPATLSAGAEA